MEALIESCTANRKQKRTTEFTISPDCAFRNILGRFERPRNGSAHRVTPVVNLTINIADFYKICNPAFRKVNKLPQRMLTKPSEPALNDGFDNKDGNLICRVHDRIENGEVVYTILDMLGTGTFGQVFRCCRADTKEVVAIKIIKNKPAYHAQGQLEIKIATMLNNQYDPNDEKHIVRVLSTFEFRNHICVVFELLNMSLLDVLTQNQFRGLPLQVVQKFTRQILIAITTLQEANVIHCDLKPENILLVTPKHNPGASASGVGGDYNGIGDDADKQSPLSSKLGACSDIKVIDFGSACYEGKTMYSYIQSRFYRSPEVLVGIPYNGSIDMWSLACVCAEMYLGLPLFPGISQHNQLSRIIEMFGPLPEYMVTNGKNGPKYFVRESGVSYSTGGLLPLQLGGATQTSKSKYRLKTPEEYAAEMKTEVPVLKKYLRYSRLDEIIMKCPLANKSKLTVAQKEEEVLRRQCFLNFLQGLFNLDPLTRWTAKQAFAHPFISNQPMTGPFVPPLDPRVNERKAAYLMQSQEKRASSQATDAVKPRRVSEPTVKPVDLMQVDSENASQQQLTNQIPAQAAPVQQQQMQPPPQIPMLPLQMQQQKELLVQQQQKEIMLQQGAQQHMSQQQVSDQHSHPQGPPQVPPLLQLQQLQEQQRSSQSSNLNLNLNVSHVSPPQGAYNPHSPTHLHRSAHSPQSARGLSSLFPNLAQQQQMQQQQLLLQKNQQRRNSDSQFHFAKSRPGPFTYPIPEDGPAPIPPLPFNNPQFETPQRATRTHSGDYDPRIGTFASGPSLQQQPFQQYQPQYSPAFLHLQDSKSLTSTPMSVSMGGLMQTFPNTQDPGMYAIPPNTSRDYSSGMAGLGPGYVAPPSGPTTDFALALKRPELDERRRLSSHQYTPQFSQLSGMNHTMFSPRDLPSPQSMWTAPPNFGISPSGSSSMSSSAPYSQGGMASYAQQSQHQLPPQKLKSLQQPMMAGSYDALDSRYGPAVVPVSSDLESSLKDVSLLNRGANSGLPPSGQYLGTGFFPPTITSTVGAVSSSLSSLSASCMGLVAPPSLPAVDSSSRTSSPATPTRKSFNAETDPFFGDDSV